MDTITFEMWVDPKTNQWSPNPLSKQEISLPATRITCPDCDGQKVYDTGPFDTHIDCVRCKAKGYILMPDRIHGDEEVIEAYFKQLEIEDFKNRADMWHLQNDL